MASRGAMSNGDAAYGTRVVDREGGEESELALGINGKPQQEKGDEGWTEDAVNIRKQCGRDMYVIISGFLQFFDYHRGTKWMPTASWTTTAAWTTTAQVTTVAAWMTTAMSTAAAQFTLVRVRLGGRLQRTKKQAILLNILRQKLQERYESLYHHNELRDAAFEDIDEDEQYKKICGSIEKHGDIRNDEEEYMGKCLE